MAELRTQIITWLHDQPNWMQEAVDRLLTKGNLQKEDINGLIILLKTADDQNKSNHRTFTGLSHSDLIDKSLRLISIGDVKGIDKLSPRNPLAFGDGNLCVIYGNNGSGKSGYARILKRVCGKPRAKKLISNIFTAEPKEQSCEIIFKSDGVEQTIKWYANDKHINELESIDIFDIDEAKFYLTGETNVSYTPPEVLLFEKLAFVCECLRTDLQDQQNKLVSKKPNLPAIYNSTIAGNKYNSVDPSLSKEILADLIFWSEENQKKLDQLKERLKAVNPGSLVHSKKKKKQALNRLTSSIKAAQSVLDKEAINRLKSLKKTADEKRKTATEGAKVQSHTAKLEGIGSETWRALWDAAQEYSKKEAYPDKEFPVVDMDARCVLCHQELRGETRNRLQNFNDFIKGKLESDAKRAEEKFSNTIAQLPAIPEKDTLDIQCESAGIDEEKITNLKNYWENVLAIVEELKGDNVEGINTGIPFPNSLIEFLETYSNELQKEINQHALDTKTFDRHKTQQNVLEMEAKQWVCQQKNAILEDVKRLRTIAKFEKWKAMANSRGVSIQAGKVSEKAITEAYVKRFNSELKELGAKKIQVELVKTRIERGRTMHQIKLKDTEHDGNTSAVLSDGERRIVALAAFLADVAGRPVPAPFVFDDPISSLDHDFEWEVAMRLAKLAEERQVIIFTHRLSFYGVLEEVEKNVRNYSSSSKKNLEQRYIEAFSGSTGHPADQQVWTQNCKTANNTLINKLDLAKRFWDDGDSSSYKIHAQAICSDFRKLIERTVEEDLLQSIVKRHRRSIMTQNKLNALVTIENKDCLFIDGLMTKYSKFEHSQSNEIPVGVPEETELREDLEALRDWRIEFKKRTA